MRDSFIFYRSFFEATEPLTKEQKAELFDAICEFALNEKNIKISTLPSAMFSLIRPQLEANRVRWENWKRGWRPTNKQETITETKPNDNQTLTKTKANVNVNVNANVNDIINNIETEENLQSIKQKKQTVDFEQFRNLYDKKVWKPKAEKKRYTLKYSEQVECLEKLPAYITTIKDKQYQKHPMTYLNQRSREDEIYSNAPDYEKLDQFDKQMWIDVQPIKEFFSKKYWPERQQKYSETKQLWKQSPLYLKN